MSGQDQHPLVRKRKDLDLRIIFTSLAALVLLAAVTSFHISPSTLFSLSAPEARLNDDVIVHLLAKLPHKNGKIHKIRDDDDILAKASNDEQEAEALVTKSGHSGQTHRSVKATQSLYSGVHSSGDPLGTHTGHLGNSDGMRALTIGPLHMGASDLAALKTEQEHVTNTQLQGLQAELRTLNEERQQIINSLTLQRQASAVKAAHDAAFADRIRLHRAYGLAASRRLRAALKVQRQAQKRAMEARAVERNELAISRVQQERAEEFEQQRRAAITATVNAEAAVKAHSDAIRSFQSQQYHQTMSGYTTQLQKYVAKDMDLLGKLRDAEDSASIGPQLEGSGVWRQAPTPIHAPEVDPVAFMDTAPLRDEGSLSEYKQTAGSTQELSQIGGGSLGRALGEKLHELTRLQSAVAVQSGGVRGVLRSRSSRRQRQVADSMKLGMADPLLDEALANPASAEGPVVEAPSDGSRIRDARSPVGVVRIPLGGHEDASQGGSGRRPPRVPRATIRDRSTEASAVRADGSRSGIAVRMAAPKSADLQVHMPHVSGQSGA